MFDTIVQMTHRKKRSKKIATYLLRIVVLFSFISIALLVVGYAQGIKFNRSTMTLESTGAINLSGKIQNVQILLNGSAIATTLPLYIKDLKPDNDYDVVIQKDGYHNWTKSFQIKESIVQSIDNIMLFKNSYIPVKAEAVDDKKICAKNSPSAKDMLMIGNGEVRFLGELITRISSGVTYGCWFKDQSHITYATNEQIRVIERGGTNDTLIHDADSFVEIVVSTENDSAIIFRDQSDKWWKIVL